MSRFCVVKLEDPRIAGNGGTVRSLHDDAAQAYEATKKSTLGGIRVSDSALRVWRAFNGCYVGQRVRLPTQEELKNL